MKTLKYTEVRIEGPKWLQIDPICHDLTLNEGLMFLLSHAFSEDWTSFTLFIMKGPWVEQEFTFSHGRLYQNWELVE
jgi:hypothetical protein